MAIESMTEESGVLNWEIEPSDSGFIGFDPDFFEQEALIDNKLVVGKKEKKILYDYWVVGDGLYKIQDWVRTGASAKDICKKIGISQNVFYKWCCKYPNLGNLVRESNLIVDVKVENALLKRALGYEYEEETVERDESGDIKKVKTTKKHVCGDVTAQTMWLKNRRPDQWTDKSNLELSGEIKNGNPFAEMSTEQLFGIVAELKTDTPEVDRMIDDNRHNQRVIEVEKPQSEQNSDCVQSESLFLL